MSEAAAFLTGGLTEDQLWRQIFDLAYMQDGTGLGLSVGEIMELEAVQKDRLLRLLGEAMQARLDAIQDAVQGATPRVRR